MKEMSLATYQASPWAKALIPAAGKEGKTTGLLASILGVLPEQTEGGIVSHPSHLHVITADSGALSGALRFLVESCRAPKEVGAVHVMNMQGDVGEAAKAKEYDAKLWGELLACIDTAYERAAKGGVHALLISSLTGFAEAILRTLSGGPSIQGDGTFKKSSMDQNKWAFYANQLAELQRYAQREGVHTFWEAHLHKQVKGVDEFGAPQEVDSLLIQGRQGGQFSYNVEQIFRLTRKFGQKYPGTRVDRIHFNCRPTLGFIANGRSFTEVLSAEEPDLTVAFRKLGLKVGGWRAAPGAAIAPPAMKKPAQMKQQ
jgi:hypothetical protein